MLRRLPLILVLCSGVALAQEESDIVATVATTADGAVLDEKEGIDGGNVEDGYTLTRLTCIKGSKDVTVLMPFTREDAEGQDGSTLAEMSGAWHLKFRINHANVEMPVSFVPIGEQGSYLDEGTQVTITHGDAFWRGLVYNQGDGVVALNGGLGQYIGVTLSPELKKFETLCALQ